MERRVSKCRGGYRCEQLVVESVKIVVQTGSFDGAPAKQQSGKAAVPDVLLTGGQGAGHWHFYLSLTSVWVGTGLCLCTLEEARGRGQLLPAPTAGAGRPKSLPAAGSTVSQPPTQSQKAWEGRGAKSEPNYSNSVRSTGKLVVRSAAPHEVVFSIFWLIANPTRPPATLVQTTTTTVPPFVSFPSRLHH